MTDKSETTDRKFDIPPEPKTQWHGLAINSLLSFLCGAQLTLYYSTMWPFLLELDPSTTETFLGFIISSHSLAQAIIAFLFGFLINKMEKSRPVIIVGFSFMLIANFLYLLSSTQLISPRWLLFSMRIFLGSGAAVYTVFRNYVVQASTFSDRSRAVSMGLATFTFGMGVGHVIQALASFIGNPGLTLVGNIRLSQYTASAFTGILINLVAILIANFLFREAEATSEKKKTAYEPDALPPYDRLGVAICILTQFVYMVLVTTVETVHPPYVMALLNWTKKDAQFYGAIRLAASTLIALAVYCLDFVFNLWNRLNQRIGAITGVLCLFLFHVLTFSWWFIPGTLGYQTGNGSLGFTQEPRGCRKSYKWCRDVPPTSPWLFNVSYAVLCGAGIAFINANMNTVFSKVIGPRKQGTLMGILVGVGCLAKTIGPLTLSALFEHFGPRPVWSIAMFFTGNCALLWLLFYRRLQPLKI